MARNTKKSQKTAAKNTNKKSRHHIHAVDRHYYSVWFDLEFMAKLRVYAKRAGVPISKVITEALEPKIGNVKIDAETKAWMEGRLKKNSVRQF